MSEKFLERIFLLMSWQINLIIVFFLLGDSPPASEFYVPTFRTHPVYSYVYWTVHHCDS